MNDKMNVKETVGGSNSMKERNPNVPNEGTQSKENERVHRMEKGIYYFVDSKITLIDENELYKSKVLEE